MRFVIRYLLHRLMTIMNQDLAVEKRKKIDPFKTVILQPSRSEKILGPSRLQDDGFERTCFKKNPLPLYVSCLMPEALSVIIDTFNCKSYHEAVIDKSHGIDYDTNNGRHT